MGYFDLQFQFNGFFEVRDLFAARFHLTTSANDEDGRQLLDVIELHDVAGDALVTAHTDPGQLLAGGLPIVLVGVQGHLHNLQPAAMILAVEFSQLYVALLAGGEAVGREIQQYHVVMQV